MDSARKDIGQETPAKGVRSSHHDLNKGRRMSAKAELFVSLRLTSKLCDLGHAFVNFLLCPGSSGLSSETGGQQENVDTKS